MSRALTGLDGLEDLALDGVQLKNVLGAFRRDPYGAVRCHRDTVGPRV